MPRKLLIDLGPLRRSRDLRALVAGQAVSVLGTQMAAVAVPYQVYKLTGSSLDVGLVSLAALGPLLAGSLLGGSIVDAVDRRRLLIVVSVISAAVTGGLALNASSRPSLWPIFLCSALAAGLGTFEDSALGAVVPNLVHRSEVAASTAMFQALFQFGLVVGPALAGLLLAGTGIRFVYLIDSVSFAAAAAAALAIAPQPQAGGGRPPGLRSVLDGIRFVGPADHTRRVRDRPQRHDLRPAARPVPRPGRHGLRRRPGHARPALRRPRRGRPDRRADHRLGRPGPAPGPRGHHRRDRLGSRHRHLRGDRSLPTALALLAEAGWADVISAVFRTTIVTSSRSPTPSSAA